MPKLSLHRRTLYDTVVMSCWCENRADLLRSTALLSVCLLFLSVGVVDPVQTQATLVCFIVWLWGVHRLITWGSLQRTGVTCLPEKDVCCAFSGRRHGHRTSRTSEECGLRHSAQLLMNRFESSRLWASEWDGKLLNRNFHSWTSARDILKEDCQERMNRESFWDKKRIAPSLSDTQNDVFN